VPGPEVLLGGACGQFGGELRPSGTNTFSTIRVAPPKGLDILYLLATLIPTLRRVPIAESSSCARALTCLPAGRGTRAGVGGPGPPSRLRPHRAARPGPRGEGHTTSSTQQCLLNCLSSVLDPLEELVACVKRATPAGDPRTLARTRAAASEAPVASSDASDRTAAAVRALFAEGAPGRALQLLTSDGVCDSETRQCWPA